MDIRGSINLPGPTSLEKFAVIEMPFKLVELINSLNPLNGMRQPYVKESVDFGGSVIEC